jgi:hypothetical protein
MEFDPEPFPDEGAIGRPVYVWRHSGELLAYSAAYQPEALPTPRLGDEAWTFVAVLSAGTPYSVIGRSGRGDLMCSIAGTQVRTDAAALYGSTARSAAR